MVKETIPCAPSPLGEEKGAPYDTKDLLRPVLAEEIVATGQVIKAGRTLVITEDGNTGTLLAKMLGTMVPTQL
ncbi:hypothetical protein [Evtepia sp.]|uniref:hypothetical protein n=1 Tax=Evtepia sp. TaxID=2773933 RepID=UPI003999C513